MLNRFPFVAAAFLVALAINADVCAQVDGEPSQIELSTADIQKLIGDLDGGFQDRLKARGVLEKAGTAAVEPLRKALPDAGLQLRQEIERLLKILEQDSILQRLSQLEKSRTAKDAQGLPEWDRFRKLVGDDEDCVSLFIRIVKAEPELFSAAAKGPSATRQLSSMLEQKASALVRTTEPDRRFSVDSYAAVLLLSSNAAYRLPGKSSYNVSAMLLDSTFVEALSSKDGDRLKRLAGSYILRERIGLEEPIRFARQNPLPEGLQLARRTLVKSLRGTNGLFAMMLLAEQGTAEDIVLLESLFDNSTLAIRVRSTTRSGYSITNGDIALAAAITLRGKDPRDFGFAPKDVRSRPFRFAAETTGFASDDERTQAREEYFRVFPKESAEQD